MYINKILESRESKTLFQIIQNNSSEKSIIKIL